MDIRKVKKLIEMLEESKISEIEIHEGEESVRISRHSSMTDQPQTYVQVPMSGQRQEATGAEPARPAAPVEPEGLYIKSPMVGTYYSAASPESPAFLSVGQQVTPDTVICIIEAMKVMNEVKAEVSGIVVEVLAENGKPVQYGQPLFRLR